MYVLKKNHPKKSLSFCMWSQSDLSHFWGRFFIRVGKNGQNREAQMEKIPTLFLAISSYGGGHFTTKIVRCPRKKKLYELGQTILAAKKEWTNIYLFTVEQ